MMLSVLVWLAMQGQVQACCNPDTDGPAKVCQQVEQCAKPAEHVIEIKTRRICVTVPSMVYEEGDLICHASGAKEIYLDGVRWGVVKGLD